MKKAILFLFILSAASASGQNLKDLLFSGKLKKDSTGVVRRTDDLSTKIDTSKKIETEKPKTNSTDLKSTPTNTSTSITLPTVAVTTTPTLPVKSNNKIWKEYTDSLTNSLKSTVFSSKKVKKETYYFSVEYEIGIDGQTGINNITVSPENDYLLAHVKQQIQGTPPQLNMVLNSANQPQKVKKRYNFFITKE